MQNAVSQIELELMPGERLLWAGQPKEGIQFRSGDLLITPFGLCFLAFAIFWEVTAMRIREPAPAPMRFIFLLFGLPFIGAGLYLAFGRLFVEARRRAQTAYGITDRRLLVITKSANRRVRSVDLAQVSDVELIEQKDSSGTIRFKMAGMPDVFTTRRNWPIATSSINSFELIPHVRQAYDVVQQARAVRAKA